MSKTAVFNVRVDLRDIATLHSHYSKHLEISSVSTLTRTTLQYLAELLITKHSAQRFESTISAAKYLEANGLMGPLRRRARTPLLREMQKESLQLEGIDPSYVDRKAGVSEDQIQKAKEILKTKLDESEEGAILGPTLGEVKK